MIIIENPLNLFMSQGLMKDEVHPLTIQGVINNEIALRVMENTLPFFTREVGGEPLGLEIYQDVSIARFI